MRRLLIVAIISFLAAASSGCCSCLTRGCCLTNCSCWNHFCKFEDWKMQKLFGAPPPFVPAPAYVAPPVYSQPPQAYVTPIAPVQPCPVCQTPSPIYTQPTSAGAASPPVVIPYESAPVPICAPIPACQPCPCECTQQTICPPPCTCNTFDPCQDPCSTSAVGTTVITTPGPVFASPGPTPAPAPAANGSTTPPTL